MIWRRLFTDSEAAWRLVVLIVVPTAALALVVAAAVKRAAAAAMRRLLQGTLATSSPLVRAPLRLIGLVTFLLVFAVLIAPAFEIAELHPRTGVHLSTLSHWIFRSGLKVLLIGAFAFALIRTVTIAVARFE